ncbi:MAG: penicillin-binding transpeptidase domain-containing protein [Erysipelotrichaceae bacterium]|nr:penicillin-binding transpeptidase domain-containing protein [Erysipelotrichaceae bacterium]
MIEFHIRKRIYFILLICFLVLSLIIGKLAYIQFIQYDFLLSKANDLWKREFTISSMRGNLVDRNQELLAFDIPSISVICVPLEIADPESTARQLADVLNSSYERIFQKITNRVSTQKLQPEGRLISESQARRIKEMNLKGVYLVQDSIRYYPNQNYLSHVLGFTGIDNQGLAGLELEYDHLLGAKSGKIEIMFDSKGKQLTQYHETLVYPGSGMTIALTIDKKIQDIVEREMKNLMLRYQPKSAWALVMDPNSGEILALSSKPDFDPNAYRQYDPSIYNQNLPIWKNYEPGSTFKSIVFAMALNEKLFDMDKDTYMDKGYEIVGGARLKSWKRGGHGLQTFREVLQNSSNPGFVEIGKRLGKEKMYQYLLDFNFGSKLNVDLPGEATGILFDYEKMGELETATTAFGQGISITSLQLVNAFCAVVNGGTLYQPYITKAILDPYTKDELITVKPQVIRQVIKEETSFQMRYALEHVVALGGGRNAYIPGYRIGGKTGTAQKAVNGVYLSNEYILSFLSAAPIDDPKVVVFIAVDAPRNDIQYGGTVVAPVVKAIYEDLLPLLGVQKVKEQVPRIYQWLDPVLLPVEDYVGKTRKEIKSQSFSFVTYGDGDVVVDQLPDAGTKLEKGKDVWLYFGKASQ